MNQLLDNDGRAGLVTEHAGISGVEMYASGGEREMVANIAYVQVTGVLMPAARCPGETRTRRLILGLAFFSLVT